MELIRAFIENPVKVSVAVLLLVLFGFIGMWQMPKQLTPEVEIPTITVETRWDGASPQEIEREIVQEQEEQLKSVEGVVRLSAESSTGRGTITLEFPIGTDISEALLKVNTKLQQVREYPEDADEPTLSTTDGGSRSIGWFILSPRMPDAAKFQEFAEKYPEHAAALKRIETGYSAGLAIRHLRALIAKDERLKPLFAHDQDVTLLRKFAEDVIEAAFERVTGIANANVSGGKREEMQVVVDPRELAARHLTIEHVRRALVGQNLDTSGGDLWEGKQRLVIRTMGQFRTPEQVSSLILARVADHPVYLRDVAQVGIGHKKPDGFVRRYRR